MKPSKKLHIVFGVVVVAGILAWRLVPQDKPAAVDLPPVNPSFNQPVTGPAVAPVAGLSDEAIKQKFKCKRITDDSLETDIYCRYPNLYRTGTLSDEDIRDFFRCTPTNQGPICVDDDKLSAYMAEQLQIHNDVKANGYR